MSVLRNMFAQADNWLSVENPALFSGTGGGGRVTKSGEFITPERSLTLSAYYACLRNIAEDMAKLPFPTYRRLTPRGKERIPDHPVSKILNVESNVDNDAVYFRSLMTHYAVGWGNGYAQIVKTGGGGVAELLPIHPARVKVAREGTKLVYVVHELLKSSVGDFRLGKSETLGQDEMLHVRGLGGDGVTGYSIARLAAESIGQAIAAKTYGSAFFANGASGGIILTHPEQLDDEAYKRMRASWLETHGGAANAYAPIILEEGMKIDRLGIPPEDVQFIETQQFSVEDIARWFRMPPHKIQHLLRSTFNNIEFQSIEYVTDTLLPWARRWEAEVNRKLYAPEERDTIYSEILFEGMLRGDQRSRAEFYGKMFQVGSLSPNDIRELENLNPVDGGDEYFIQVNMQTLENAEAGVAPPAKPQQKPPTKPQPKAADRTELYQAVHTATLASAIGRALTKEAKAVRRAVAKCKGDTEALAAWAEQFYAEHQTDIAEELGCHYAALARLVGAERGVESEDAAVVAGRMASLYSQEHARESIRDLLASNVEASVNDWLTKRAARAALQETKAIASAVAALASNNHEHAPTSNGDLAAVA